MIPSSPGLLGPFLIMKSKVFFNASLLIGLINSCFSMIVNVLSLKYSKY